MHITNRNPAPQSSLEAVPLNPRTGSGARFGTGTGNRVYELGVRTERGHGTGIPSPVEKPESPLARYFARDPDHATEIKEMQDLRKWLSAQRRRVAPGGPAY